MAYSIGQITTILLKADKTMYKLGDVAYDNMFSELDEAYDYERDIIFIYKKAVEYADDYFVGTLKLDQIVDRLASKLNIYDYGTLSPLYVDVYTQVDQGLNVIYVLKSTALSLGAGLTGDSDFSQSDININLDYAYLDTVYVIDGRTLTINGTTYDLSANRTWSVGTVTSVSALTLGTTGTDLSSTVANSTTTPTITLNVPTASATNRGALSSADWTIFNGKQGAIILTTTGSSGSSTLIGTTLNIPNYTLGGLGGVPASRQLTINGTSYDLSADRSWNVGTVTSVDMSVPTGLTISGNPITSSGTLAIGLASGYSIPTTANQTNWTTAYNDSIVSAAVTGTTTKTLTLTQQDAGTITASWTDINTDAVTSVFGRTGAVVAAEGDYTLTQLGDVTITTPSTNQVLKYNGTAWVNSADTDTGITSLNGLTALTQTFATGTSGSDFNISSGTSTHTFNLPTASATNRGLLSTSDWTLFNGKESALTFSSPLSRATNTISIPAATTSVNGYLTSTDWTTFNNKVGGSGTSGQIAYWNGTATQTGSADFAWDNTNKYLVSNIGLSGYVKLAQTGWNSGFIQTAYSNFIFGSNLRYDGTQWIYDQSGFGVQFQADSFNGYLQLNTATSGTGGNTATINPRLRILNDGRTFLGTSIVTDDTTSSLQVGGSGRFTGTLKLDTINAATTDTDKFLVSDGGIIKFRTGTEILSDIGGQGSLTLTTTGTSGAATLIGNTLNVPQYEAEGNYVTTATTLTINGTTYDLSANRSWSVGTVTSVGLSMPVAFSVSNTPITSSGTLAVTAVGTSSQYIRGDGQLATLPSGSSGGSSVNYYLNGSVNQGTIGGSVYYEMNRSAIIGVGTDFTRTNGSGNGLIAQFITDVADPNRLEIPGGAWNFEMYFSASSSGGSPTFYVELLKYNGTTFTSIASNVSNAEVITGGTTIDLYVSSLAVPQTTLLATDRLAIRVYITTSGKDITLHTEDNHLCEIITTFAGGVSSLNGLTANTQYFAVGTAGTDFAISSLSDTHTFNLPTASATNRGALSSADWTTFNGKQNAITLTTTGTSGAATLVGATLNIPQYQAAGTYVTSVTGTSPIVSSGGTTPAISIPAATTSVNGYLTSTDWTTFNGKFNLPSLTSGSVLFSNGTTIAQDNANFFWDDTNNRLGIGTATPYSRLSINGNAADFNSASTKISVYADGSSTYGIGFSKYTNYGLGLFSANNFTDSPRVFIESTGNVGIGTTSPAAKLEVAGDIKVLSTGAAIYASTEGVYFAGTVNGNYLSFSTNSAERARITNGGNVLIGNTTNRLRLTVSGADANAPTLGTASGTTVFANAAVTTQYGMNFGISSSGYGWIQQHRFDGTATAYALALQPSGGRVLIGTATDNGTDRLQVSGSSTFSSSVTATQFNGKLYTGATYNFEGGYFGKSSGNGGALLELLGHGGVSTSNGFALRYDTDVSGNLLFQYAGSQATYGALSYSTILQLTSAGAATFSSSVTASSLIKSGGTSAQILAADGSVITAGTNITISGGTISASGGGTVTGTGTTNYIPKFTGASALGDSAISQSATGNRILIGATDDTTSKLRVSGATRTSTLIVDAGTASVAPINFTLSSAALMTNNLAGDVEVNSAGHLYYSFWDEIRGVVNAEQFLTNTSTYTLTSTISSQKLFNVGPLSGNAGALTVKPSTTYFFECMFSLTSMSSTSGSARFDLKGAGTAGVSSTAYSATGIDISTITSSNFLNGVFSNSIISTELVTGGVGTGMWVQIKGIFRTNGTAGTIIPSIQLVTAAAAIVGVNSFFRVYPIGSDTANYQGQ